MSYINFLKNELGDNFKTVVRELGFLNEVSDPEVLVVRELQGSVFKNSEVLPILIEAHTNDVIKTMDLFNNFINKNQSKYIVDGLKYIKQNYNTPFVSNVFQDNGLSVMSIVQVSATLVISENVSDVEYIKIDGEDIYFDSIDDNYIASEKPDKLYTEDKFKTTIQGAINKIQISSIAFRGEFYEKVRLIRGGVLPIGTAFNVELKNNDSEVVLKFIMKLGSYSVAYSSANIPFVTIALTE